MTSFSASQVDIIYFNLHNTIKTLKTASAIFLKTDEVLPLLIKFRNQVAVLNIYFTVGSRLTG